MNELRRKKMEARIVRELAELIQKRRTKDERLGFVSVARVRLADDLTLCTIHVSLFDPDPRANQTTFRALEQAAGFFQSTIARDLRLRQTPRFVFAIDDSVKEGDSMLNKLMEGHRARPEGEGESDAAPADDSDVAAEPADTESSDDQN